MLPGECVGFNGVECMDCGTVLTLEVCYSMAGYYLGYNCPCCGPYSRETGYFKTRWDAEKAMEFPEPYERR